MRKTHSIDTIRIKPAFSCVALLLFAACVPVYLIQRNYATASPIGDDCVSAVIIELKLREPNHAVHVIATPSPGVEEVFISDDYAAVSWRLAEDRSAMELFYGSHGSTSRREIESARSLILALDNTIRRSCSGAENMALASEECIKIECRAP